MTQQESVVTRTRKSTKAVRVSWRHAFSEKFALRTGLEYRSETVEQSLETSENTQAFAQLSANLPPNGRLVLGGSLYQGGQSLARQCRRCIPGSLANAVSVRQSLADQRMEPVRLLIRSAVTIWARERPFL
jgi:hypothetical protein